METRRAIIIKLVTVLLLFPAAQLTDASNSTQSQPVGKQVRQCLVPLMASHPDNAAESRLGISIIDDGTDEGILALLDRECELAMASRKMGSEEMREAESRGMDIRETRVGGIGMAIAVHPTNPVDELTVDQVRKIFDGTFTAWNQVGGASQAISVVTVCTNDSRITGYFTQARPGAPVQRIASQAKRSLEELNEVALVHVGETELQPKVKFLAIKRSKESAGVLPSPQNVKCGMYPFIQPLYLYIDWKNAADQAKAFFAFCGSQNGHVSEK